MPTVHIVSTDQDPEFINQVALEVYRRWVEFALGQVELGGRRIKNPTGKYASSISIRRYGTRTGVRRPGEIPKRTVTHIAIIANEKVAPEAAILETGHRAIDMLEHLKPNTAYPIHREGGPPPLMIGQSAYARSQVRSMWSTRRQASLQGLVKTPRVGEARGARNTSGTGPAWTIPAMPAYAPAQILSELIRESYGLESYVR